MEVLTARTRVREYALVLLIVCFFIHPACAQEEAVSGIVRLSSYYYNKKRTVEQIQTANLAFFNSTKIILLTILITGLNFSATFSQETNDTAKISRNTIFVEGLGNGGLGSINFDHLFIKKNSFKLSSRAGGIFIPRKDPNYKNKQDNFWSTILEVNLFWGGKGNLEMGIGLSYMKGANSGIYYTTSGGPISYSSSTLLIVPRILGFRFQQPRSGFFCKIGIIGLIQIAEYDKETKNDPDYRPMASPFFSFGCGYTL